MSRNDWWVGESVEVYDPDEHTWLPGVIEEFAKIQGFDFTIVQTDSAVYQGLPLKIAVPSSHADWIRSRPPPRA